MDDSDDSISESSDILREENLDEIPVPKVPLVQDLTEDDKFLSDESSLSSLVLTEEIKPRPYQLEMFEESLKRNIIVAMDTGSGKTTIAIMRMLHELEKTRPDQIIWFLAPTVSLCTQQFEVIQSQISAVQVKFLSGADEVDRWTEQSHWDAVLLNVKIVVSTYQILLDALSHGFIQMGSLALIVFDEVHNCIEKHPGAVIMRNFYHKRKAMGLNVPHILGLTASPVMRSSTSSVGKIEETLDAICRTPSKHRAELRLQVKLPVLSQVHYSKTRASGTPIQTKLMTCLSNAFHDLKLSEDPYYLTLLKDDSGRGRRKLDEIRLSQKTSSSDQIKSFNTTARKIWEELGSWAADFYISEVVSKVLALARQSDNPLGIWDVSSAEKQYIAKALRHINVEHGSCHGPAFDIQTTDKVEKMMDVLLVSTDGSFSGIVFVQERAVAAILAKLISIHPKTSHRFNVGVIVGTSKHNLRARNIGELVDVNEHKDTLSKFKKGKINLLIATSVLEEGIDVPICNLVVCFQKPANLKSFVQRRGRARHRDSRLVLLLSDSDKVDQWQQLEADMRRIYEDEMRTLQELILKEDGEDGDGRSFQVETTNALLDLDNAVSHLYHFCATLPASEFVDLRPEFICNHGAGNLVTATVLLPISVDKAVRSAESKKAWTSEKNAIKDAAFEAYLGLYRAGLVNDNLLPLLRHDAIVDDLKTSPVEHRASIVSVSEQLNPWVQVARAWLLVEQGIDQDLGHAAITVGDLEVDLYMPVHLPEIPAFPIYWDIDTMLLVSTKVGPCLPAKDVLLKLPGDTLSLLHAGFGSRFLVENKLFPMQLVAHSECSLRDLFGRHDAINTHGSLSPLNGAVIRNKSDPNIAYTFRHVLYTKPDIRKVQYPYPDYDQVRPDVPHLSLQKVPKRDDFIHKVFDAGVRTSKEFSYVLPINRCTVDDLPFKFAQFGRLIPSIMHRFEVAFIAEELSRTILQNVKISDLRLVLTSISASSAREDSNYQRLEFIGDSILKTCASIQLISEYPLWYEGLLSKRKDRLVSNSRLQRAAREIGLDKFIITKPFTGNKWRPPYVEDLLKLPASRKTRDMSTKVLADVVEALVGAATVDGDIPKALACLQTFLPELEWKPLEVRRLFLYQRTPDIELPITLKPLETLIGYTFKRKSLLVEAFTHASCNSGSGSLERFEFLGDSILDNIIVTAMWPHDLSHYQMHLLRTALVNADFLAFICMEWSIEHEVIDLQVHPTNGKSAKIEEKHKLVSWPLWRFMRHMSPKLGFEQATTVARHAELRDEIKGAIESGTHYPWALLSRLRAQKYYSDIVESLLGAVWIDSGSFDVCKDLVHRMGILPYFERILRDGVHVLHPKEELGILSDEKKVRYVMEKTIVDNNDGEEEQERKYICTVFVGEERIVTLMDNVEKGVLQTMTAEKAIEILKKRSKLGEEDLEMDVQVEAEEDGSRQQNLMDTTMADD